MDTSYEDKMYRQVEKSISNNINDKLFIPIEMIDKTTLSGRYDKRIVDSVSYEEKTGQQEPVLIYDTKYDKGDASYNIADEYKEAGPRLSRAEYILQAREACLRQMNTFDTTGRISNIYAEEENSIYSSQARKRRGKVERLFNDGSEEEDLPEEIASFRSLIIRTVCALVIFLSIFVIDKVKVDWGAFSYESIRHYVTGNNQLEALEEILVSWFK